MIFGSNTTALGAMSIPMAEGYDCSFGASLALVEGARNDFAMFKAMVNADYREMAICRESTGVVQEGEVRALQEAVGGGIFKRIADIFKKLIAKIKSIVHTFIAKINTYTMKKKELVKKYQKELLTKKNINNLEVKWRKHKDNDLDSKFRKFGGSEDAKSWKEDSYDRVKFYLDSITDSDSIADFKTNALETLLDDEDTVKLSDIGGIRSILSYIDTYDKDLKDFEKKCKNITTEAEKHVKEYDKRANDAAKDAVNAKGDAVKEKDDALDAARKEYDMAMAYQTAAYAVVDVLRTNNDIRYKQHMAAFMKAIAANSDKLEESAIYAEAVAEATEQEVEDVIGNAMSDEEISKISAASKDIADASMSDCPNALTKEPDCYSADDTVKVAGTVDTDINSREESALFGAMFY